MMKKQNTASAKSKRFITNTIVHVILAVLAVIWVIPIAWIIMISFRGESGQYISTLIPKTFTLNNYKKLFTDTQILNFPQMFINTLIISIFSCVISTFFVLSVSYCMSRMRFKMRKPMMNIALVLGMFPGFMSMIAVYYILKSVGLSVVAASVSPNGKTNPVQTEKKTPTAIYPFASQKYLCLRVMCGNNNVPIKQLTYIPGAVQAISTFAKITNIAAFVNIIPSFSILFIFIPPKNKKSRKM